MSKQDIKAVLDTAGAALNRGDIDGVIACFTDDAVLMVHEGQPVKGKADIRTTLELIAAYFNHTLQVSQTDLKVLVESNMALATTLTTVNATMADGSPHSEQRLSTYIFKLQKEGPNTGKWLCSIDNSYGTPLPCQPELPW
ncbi:SgcJ/EcaC family oxidoreductase [Magnetovibrio sp. PR-2]|uniref:YybH family protein n=1 Tax=Magnetovibrio sp. PR-2 TaxID=3120356 RepID=UPI002FCDE6BC